MRKIEYRDRTKGRGASAEEAIYSGLGEENRDSRGVTEINCVFKALDNV